MPYTVRPMQIISRNWQSTAWAQISAGCSERAESQAFHRALGEGANQRNEATRGNVAVRLGSCAPAVCAKHNRPIVSPPPCRRGDHFASSILERHCADSGDLTLAQRPRDLRVSPCISMYLPVARSPPLRLLIERARNAVSILCAAAAAAAARYTVLTNP